MWPPPPSVVAAVCVVGVPPVWAVAGGRHLGLALAAAGAVLVVTAFFYCGCPVGGLSSPYSLYTRVAACRLVLGLSVGLAIVTLIGYRVAVRNAPPTLSIDARGPITLRGRAAADLRPSAAGVRYLPVVVESFPIGVAGAGRAGSGSPSVGRSGDASHSRWARASCAPAGDTVFVRADGDTVRSGTIWANSDAMTVEPAQSATQQSSPSHTSRDIPALCAPRPTVAGVNGGAYVLGDRSGIDPATYDAVRRSGAAHVLALSGMHLGVLALAVTWLGKRLLSRNVAICTTVLVLGSYVWIAGWIPSLLRALAMVGCASVSRVLGRREAPVVILSRAVLLLALIDPAIVYQLGFQYSVLALTGILCLSPVTAPFSNISFRASLPCTSACLPCRAHPYRGSVTQRVWYALSCGNRHRRGAFGDRRGSHLDGAVVHRGRERSRIGDRCRTVHCRDDINP